VFVKLLMNMSLIRLANRISGNDAKESFLSHLLGLFKNPVGKREFNNGVCDITFDRPLHCFNLLHVIREMQSVHEDTKTLRLHFEPLSNVIDHTSVEAIFHYVEEYKLKGVEVELDGWDQFVPLSEHDRAIRIGLVEKLSHRHSGLAEGVNAT
jgi:carbonic anhydrase